MTMIKVKRVIVSSITLGAIVASMFTSNVFAAQVSDKSKTSVENDTQIIKSMEEFVSYENAHQIVNFSAKVGSTPNVEKKTYKEEWVLDSYYDKNGKLVKSKWVGDSFVNKDGKKVDVKLDLVSTVNQNTGIIDIKANLSPKEVTSKTVVYTSSNPSVATVSQGGKVTPVKAGTTTILAKISNKIQASVSVTVLDSKSAPTANVIEVEENSILTLMSSSNKESIKMWKSKDPSIATVTKNQMRGRKLGTTQILGVTNIGKVITANVKVTKKTIKSTDIVLPNEKLELEKNAQPVQLLGVVSPEIAENKTVTYKTNDKKVATVDEQGIVTPVGAGETVITATNGTVSAQCKVYVYEENVIIENGVYTIKSLLNDNYLDIVTDDKENMNAVLSEFKGQESAQFNIVKNQNDTYSIAPMSDPYKAVMVNRGETMEDTINIGDNVDVWQNSDPEASEWVFTKLRDNGYMVTLPAYKVGAVAADSTDKNANVSYQSSDISNKSQIWVLTLAKDTGFAGGNGDGVEMDSGDLVSPKGDNTAPDFYSPYYAPENNIFSRLELYGQCTWYSAGRAYEVTGKPVPMINGAHTWLDVAEKNGYKTGMKPKPNSIAVWKKSTYGHVAFVEAVDGDNVIITESNWSRSTSEKKSTIEDGMYHYEGYTSVPTEKMKDRSGYILAGYVYLD